MRLTAIGTSGSFPGPTSAASCYLLEAEAGGRTHRILLDLGSGALGALQAHCSPAQIDAVVLTHLHPDHCLDVTGLYVHRCYDPDHFFTTGEPGGGRAPLPVWGPAGTERRLAAAYHTDPGLSPCAEQAHETDLTTVFAFHDITPGARFEVGPFAIESFLVDHPVEAYALRVTGSDGGVLTYSGDSDECEALVAAARDADVFLCEAAFQEDRDTVRGIHLTGLRAGRVATAAAARALVLTHIPPWTDTGTVRAEAAAEFAGPIGVAAPGGAWTIDPIPAAGRPTFEETR
ncbi:MBL fold metallo-hydrolase [Brevibacterium sp. R8603A2]|uniref:MBL fold metallo-hydrolase n=1 Tax=Brevibacterium sp. R8603A2 TaxID=2929779 RepID=UPI001FF9CE6E|nr:MBL fold metallo-hydrolase [Brevibacterium sp. R8603A2]MCK1803753.1 MBL fold metallo-hydrolase [Brevibacterium sp. R8603A2]